MSNTAPSNIAQPSWQTTDWRKSALCAEVAGPKLFFPVGVTGAAEIQIEDAKDVCGGCPVVAPCLSFAIETNQEYGIWGGKSEEERRALRRVWRAERRAQRVQLVKFQSPNDLEGDSSQSEAG